MAEELIDGDPFAAFGGQAVKTPTKPTPTKEPLPTDNPFKSFGGDIVPKKVSGQGASSTLPSLPIGGNNDLTSLLSGNNSQQDLLPVTDQDTKVQIRQQQTDTKNKLSKQLSTIKSYLDPQRQKSIDNAIDIASQQAPDGLSEVTPEQQQHYQFMQTPVGKTLGAVAYLGSKATKGSLQVAKGLAHYTNMAFNGTNPGMRIVSEIGANDAFERADDAANYGLTKGDQTRIDDNKVLSNLGGLAEFAPAAAGSASTGGATLFLQGAGQAQEQIDKAQKQSGVEINPLVKEAFIGGTGIVNKFLMHDLAGGVFGKLPAGLRGDITAQISADAIKEAAGKKLTGEQFNNLLQTGAQEWADKVAKTGFKAIQGTSKAALDLSGLATSNFLLKKGVDATTDKPVFNENIGDLAQTLTDIATKTAPAFGLAGAASSLTKLTPYSTYKNSVVESLMSDPSDANVAKIKQDIQDHVNSRDASQQWTPEEMDATIQHVDKIADIARKLPRGIPEKKVVDAVDLVNGRDELKNQLSNLQEQRGQLDESVKDIPSDGEQLLVDKIDQANDKLKAIATGKPVTYSKEPNTEDGEDVYYKKFKGQEKEEITPSRYQLENLERESNQQSNDIQPEANENIENNVSETPQANETGVQAGNSAKPTETNGITDEQRLGQNAETDAKVKAFQEKFPDRKVDPLEDLPDSVVRTFDRVDNDLPTDPVAINEASDWLYNKYKQLTAMKGSDTRLLTTKQIDAMQEQLGEDITLLENHKLKYHGENDQVPTGETGGQAENQTVQPTEQTDGSTNEITGGVEQQEHPTEIAPPPIEVNKTQNENEPARVAEQTASPTEPNPTATDVTESAKEKPAATDETVSEKSKVKKAKTAEAIKNENTKAKAEEAGIELDDHVGEKRSREVVDAESKKELKGGYDSHELVRKILEDGHIPNDTEVAILAKHTATVEKNFKDLSKRLETDGATMDKREFDDLSHEHDQAARDYQDALNADVKSGTAQSRGLNARKFAVKNDYSLGQMIKNKRADTGGEKLTTEQIAEVTKRFEQIEKANADYEKRIGKLETDNANLKAEKNFKRIKDGEARLQRKAVTKEALAEDRKKIAADFSEKLKQMRSQGLNSAPKALAEFLMAAAPYATKMVRNFALEGVTEAKEMAAKVKEALGLDEVSDRDMLDLIGGVYNEKKGTRTEIEKQIRDLKTQARLMGEIEDAENKIKKATKPKPQISAKVAELRKRLAELQKGEPMSKEETSLKQSKTATSKRILDLEKRIREKDFEKPEVNQVKEDAELKELRRTARKLEHDYQVERHKDLLKQRSKQKRVWDFVKGIGGISRAVKATLDFSSAVFRQGLYSTISRPGTAAKSYVGMWKFILSEHKYEDWLYDLKETPEYEQMQKAGLYISDKNSPEAIAREEDFENNLIEKLPIIGKGFQLKELPFGIGKKIEGTKTGEVKIGEVKIQGLKWNNGKIGNLGLIGAAERGYSGYINLLRTNMYAEGAASLEAQGKSFEGNKKAYQDLAKAINTLTGRGSVPEFAKRATEALSFTLFSPRFIASRLNVLNPYYYVNLEPTARKMALRDVGITLSSMSALAIAAHMYGQSQDKDTPKEWKVSVSFDPLSSDFMKIKVGDTRVDLFGGQQQYIVMLAKLQQGGRRNLKGGFIKFNDGKYHGETYAGALGQFARGKLAPTPSMALNLAFGNDAVGNPYHWTDLYKEYSFLSTQDTYDIVKDGGALKALLAFPLIQSGFGVNTYDASKPKNKQHGQASRAGN